MMVFKLDWDGGTAFLTWSGEAVISRSLGFKQNQNPIIEISKRFGVQNGLKMGQQVKIVVACLLSSPLRTFFNPLRWMAPDLFQPTPLNGLLACHEDKMIQKNLH